MRAQDRALLDGPFPRGGLARGVSDSTLLLDEDQPVRDLALARIRALGASVVRIQINWASLLADTSSPGSEISTSAFDARDPANPAYRFATIDSAVRSAVAAGLQPLLVVSHAPAFAQAPQPWPYAFPGSWAPSPAALEDFAVALARRYGGSFPDPLAPGRTLPRVRLFQAWNEPNLARYLEPQWVAQGGRWSAFSPQIYRQMLDGFYAGVKSVQPTDVVVAAGLAPNGDPAGVGRVAPVTFLRELLCLGAASGGGAGAGRSGEGEGRGHAPCADPPHFDALAFHPLSVGNPDVPASSALDVSIADAAKITELLHEAERLHTVLPAGRKAVWVTELNWESDPPAPRGVPARLQALWVSRALHRLWVAGVGLVDWQFLVDPYPALRLGAPTGGGIEVSRPAGLYSPGPGGDFALARAKPMLQGFAFPFDPLRLDRRRVRVWALLARPRERVLLQRLVVGGRSWRTVARLRGDAAGVLNVLVRLSGAGSLRLRSGSGESAAVRVAARRA